MSGSAGPKAGTRFELRVLADLRANGYWGMRSPASKSPIDLVAIKPGQVLFVQCKIGGWLDPAGWNALWEACAEAGAVPVLASRPARGLIRYERLTWPKSRPGLKQPKAEFVIDVAERPVA